MIYNKGELVMVSVPYEENTMHLCMVTAITIPCVVKINEFYMVYSIIKKEKFITTEKFMNKIN